LSTVPRADAGAALDHAQRADAHALGDRGFRVDHGAGMDGGPAAAQPRASRAA
jgi:hypothetical protein